MGDRAVAQAQLAYRMGAAPDFAAQPSTRKRMRVVPGTRERGQEKQSSALVTIAKMAAILFVAAALFACARIAINAMTVSTMIESDAISTQITQARSTGVGLEMEQSVLTSQPALNTIIKRFNMRTPYEVGTIALAADVVAYNADGSLSLSATVRNTVGTAE